MRQVARIALTEEGCARHCSVGHSLEIFHDLETGGFHCLHMAKHLPAVSIKSRLERRNAERVHFLVRGLDFTKSGKIGEARLAFPLVIPFAQTAGGVGSDLPERNAF